MPGNRIRFDDWTWHELDLLARDRMMDLRELADEAFSDLLKKHGRPTDLKTALRESVKKEGSKGPISKKEEGTSSHLKARAALCAVLPHSQLEQ
jgi:hypothetical protein